MIELSEKLQVKQPERPVTYQLRGAGHIHPLTKKPMYKSGFDWRGSETIFDPGDKKPKLLQYVVHTDIVDGKTVEHIGTVQFPGKDKHNLLTIQPQNFNLILYMERSNYNGSNPFRDKTYPIRFERIDNEAIAESNEEKAQLELEAMLLIHNMPEQALYDYAKSMPGVNVDVSYTVLKGVMRGIAKSNPKKFIDNSGSAVVKTKAVIHDALEYKVIKFNHQTHTYEWVQSGGEVVTVPKGQDPVSYLADHFLNDSIGEEQYALLEKELGGGGSKKGRKPKQ